MLYPPLQTIAADRETVAGFGGLNREADAAPGEFSRMENMTARYYPLAAACPGHKVVLTPCPQGLLAKAELCRVQENRLYVGEQTMGPELTPGDKRLVSMGAYVLIFPDKVYVNTADGTDWGDMEQLMKQKDWFLDPCDEQGNPISIRFRGSETPLEAEEGNYWCDTGATRYILRRFQKGSWVTTKGYMWLHFRQGGVMDLFSRNMAPGDQVILQILGDQIIDDDTSNPVTDPELSYAVAALAGEVTIHAIDGPSAIITGVIPKEVAIRNYLRFTRPMPEMDFLFECGNRLWGCRYGFQNGSFVNEIYASGLGDFRNFTAFRGVSTDPYTLSVGTDGPFTGAINYLGYPLFFKETCLHRIYGSYPAEYRLQTVPCQGVAQGSGDSLCLLGDTALYLGRTGVCAYDGAMSSLISRGLGTLEGPALGEVNQGRYYLSLPEGLYVYDSFRRLWHRESPVDAVALCAWDGRLFCADRIRDAMLELEAGEEDVEFSCTTSLIAGTRQQRIRSVCLRYSLSGWGRVLVEYDSCGQWQEGGALTPGTLGWTNLPLRPRRCDHFRLRLEGRGRLRLHSISLTLEKGSDLP